MENVVRQHPAVDEAAVIGKGSAKGKPTVKAFVKLNSRFNASARLSREIKAYVRSNLHSQIPLAEVEFMDELPKTRSGKMLRRVLRVKELGLPMGDPSRLEE